jgi:CHASE3 domain sensor protein
MAAYPSYDVPELVTKDEFRAGLAELRAEMAELRADLRGELHQGLAAVNQRIDRLFLAMMGGFVVLLGAMVGLAFLP